MDGHLHDRREAAPERDAEQTRRHGVGAAWIAVCLAHDAFAEGDVEWLMEIAARRRGDMPGEAD